MKAASTLVLVAAAGAAAYWAYSSMKPSAKQQLKRDFKNTAEDMADVKNDMCGVRQDITEMAKNLKTQM